MNHHRSTGPSTASTRRAVLGATAAVLLLAVTACEEEDGAATVDVADGVAPLVDPDALRETLLTPADLRGGWDEDFDQRDDLLAASCLGVDLAAEPATTGRAARLSDDDGEVEQRVLVFASDDAGGRHLDRFAADDARECLADTVRRRAMDNGSDGDVTIEAVTIESYAPGWATGADRVAGYRAVVGVEAYDVSFELHVDVVAAHAGRTVSLLAFSEVGEPLPDDVEADAVRAVVARLRGDGIA